VGQQVLGWCVNGPCFPPMFDPDSWEFTKHDIDVIMSNADRPKHFIPRVVERGIAYAFDRFGSRLMRGIVLGESVVFAERRQWNVTHVFHNGDAVGKVVTPLTATVIDGLQVYVYAISSDGTQPCVLKRHVNCGDTVFYLSRSRVVGAVYPEFRGVVIRVRDDVLEVYAGQHDGFEIEFVFDINGLFVGFIHSRDGVVQISPYPMHLWPYSHGMEVIEVQGVAPRLLRVAGPNAVVD